VKDTGQVEARLRVGVDEYVIRMTQVGAAQPVHGGVVTRAAVHGASGLGYSFMTPSRAAAAVWGVGEVSLNGKVISRTAEIYAEALVQGAHADDETHRILRDARAGDAEVNVIATGLPTDVVPLGYVELDFEDVQISIDGEPVQSLASVPNEAAGNQALGSLAGVSAGTVNALGLPASALTPGSASGGSAAPPPQNPALDTAQLLQSAPPLGVTPAPLGATAGQGTLSTAAALPTTPQPLGTPGLLNAGAPLPGTPAPLGASVPVMSASPAPLNAAPALALPSTPAPL